MNGQQSLIVSRQTNGIGDYSMVNKAVCSEKETVDGAVFELMSSFGYNNMRMLVYFASKSFDPIELSAKMHMAFPETTILGCSMDEEIVSGRMLRGTVLAMAFDVESLLDVKVEVIENISNNIDLTRTFKSFEKYFGEAVNEMEPTSYLGIILSDKLSCREDRLIDLLSAKTKVYFISGSSADDYNFQATYVFANGKAYSDAAVLALLKPATL